MVMLGWKAGPEQYPPLELLDYAIAAEQAGFDTLDASDHFHPWSDEGQASFVWTWLGAVAARTTKLRLGTGVTCPILRYHPSVIAQAAATLGAMAPGRAYLALGTGEALNEYSSTGIWPEYEERRDRLFEAIEIIRALWTGEQVTYSGAYYETKKARLYTRPEQPLPLYVSALVPESATFAGAHADGLFTVGGEQPELYTQMLARFEEAARTAGKDPSRMHRAIELNVAYTDDAEGAIRAQKTFWAGALIPAMYSQRIYTPSDSAKNGAVAGNETIRQKVLISGRPEDHIAFARQYIELGFDELYFHCPGPDQRAFLEGYGRDVLPKLRE